MKTLNYKIRASQIFSLFISLTIFFTLFSGFSNVRSDDSSLSPAELSAKTNAITGMENRQKAVNEAFANIKKRIDTLVKNDPRRDRAKDAVNAAGKATVSFMQENPETDLLTDPYGSNETFNNLEKNALNAINAVNSKLLAPDQPGNVPNPDILTDFIPWLIRTFFRFASLAVFISFIVSGVMFVIAFGVEERVTKAKHILYYTLIGFSFITLAFAIVKAVTNIDFFGFI